MFDDLDETIRQLLIAEMPIDRQSEVDIEFDLPRRENTANWIKPAIINFFLYDVRENNILRQQRWERLPDGNGGNNQARLKRTPLRVDCSYMITTWAKFPVDQHRLLSRCLLTLSRFPVLPPERLVGSLQNPPFDIQARVASHDRLTNPAEMWSALDNEIHPSLSYVVTLAMDPWTAITEPLVHTVHLQTGQAGGLPEQTGLLEGSQHEMTWVGGIIRDKSQPDTVLEGIEVGIKGTGWFTKTDELGHFILNCPPPGDNILVIWPPAGDPIQKKITVPVKGESFDPEKHEVIDLEILI